MMADCVNRVHWTLGKGWLETFDNAWKPFHFTTWTSLFINCVQGQKKRFPQSNPAWLSRSFVTDMVGKSATKLAPALSSVWHFKGLLEHEEKPDKEKSSHKCTYKVCPTSSLHSLTGHIPSHRPKKGSLMSIFSLNRLFLLPDCVNIAL